MALSAVHQVHANNVARNEDIEKFNKLFSSQQWADALNVIKSYTLDPVSQKDLWIDKVKCHVSLKQFQEARTEIQLLLKHRPDDLRTKLQAGIVEKDSGNHDLAIKILADCELSAPNNVWPYILLSQMYFSKKDYVSARGTLSQCALKTMNTATDKEYNHCLSQLALARTLVAAQSSSQLAIEGDLFYRTGRAIENCLRVSMVKDEEDIIYSNLLASYRLGIRYYVIADNASNDCTRAEIERFASDYTDSIVFVVSDPIVGYYQDSKTMALAKFGASLFEATGRKIEWVLPLDADEFMYFSHEEFDFADVIQMANSSQASVIIYYMNDASSECALQSINSDTDLVSTFPVVAPVEANSISKVCFRLTDNAFVSMGNHFLTNRLASESEMFVGLEHGLMMLHYPLRSISHVRSKVINGGRAFTQTVGRPLSGGHWRMRYEQYLKIGDSIFHDLLHKYIIDNRRRRDASLS